jgi:hypothetical protein
MRLLIAGHDTKYYKCIVMYWIRYIIISISTSLLTHVAVQLYLTHHSIDTLCVPLPATWKNQVLVPYDEFAIKCWEQKRMATLPISCFRVPESTVVESMETCSLIWSPSFRHDVSKYGFSEKVLAHHAAVSCKRQMNTLLNHLEELYRHHSVIGVPRFVHHAYVSTCV